MSLIEIIFWQTRRARALLKRAEQQKRVWPLQVWELVCCLAVRSPFYLHGLRSACCQLFTRVFRFPISHTTKLNWNECKRPGGPSLVWSCRLMFHYSVNLELCIIHGWLGHIRLQWTHHLVPRIGKHKIRWGLTGVIGPLTTDISTWDLQHFLFEFLFL